MEYKMKSSEDFRRSVYAKKLAQDMKRQHRRHWAAGIVTVLTAAVICFGLGMFSGRVVFAPGGPEHAPEMPLFASAYGDSEYARVQADASGECRPIPRDALDLRLVMCNAPDDKTVAVQLTNTSEDTPLRLVSVRIVSSETSGQNEQADLVGLMLQPGESQTVALELGTAGDGRLLDADFHYVMEGETISPLLKKTISLVWQIA